MATPICSSKVIFLGAILLLDDDKLPVEDLIGVKVFNELSLFATELSDVYLCDARSATVFAMLARTLSMLFIYDYMLAYPSQSLLPSS